MRTSTIFKSRWMALIWAAGIIWLACDVAGSEPSGQVASANASQPTDATGAPMTDDDEQRLAEQLNAL